MGTLQMYTVSKNMARTMMYCKTFIEDQIVLECPDESETIDWEDD